MNKNVRRRGRRPLKIPNGSARMATAPKTGVRKKRTATEATQEDASRILERHLLRQRALRVATRASEVAKEARRIAREAAKL
jgi:hypothetical protein